MPTLSQLVSIGPAAVSRANAALQHATLTALLARMRCSSSGIYTPSILTVPLPGSPDSHSLSVPWATLVPPSSMAVRTARVSSTFSIHRSHRPDRHLQLEVRPARRRPSITMRMSLRRQEGPEGLERVLHTLRLDKTP
ncbi:MAG: hypothetical protein AAFV53_33870 [Myxococcota bacterium]